MPRLIRPTTSSQRKMSFGDFESLSGHKPTKSLTVHLRKHSGRDASGKMSIRHRGGGVKRAYRLVDFSLKPFEGNAKITSIEYDPNRSAFISVIELPGEGIAKKVYILSPDGVKVGDTVSFGATKQPKVGSRMKLKDIAIGQAVHSIELQPGKGGQLARSAGSSALLSSKEGKYAQIKLPSSEIRQVLLECYASVGRVSNPTHNLIRLAKAGRKRRMGFRPSVRGKAMNPVSHPHGGGEGVNSIGLKHPKTPWGKPALGHRTRKNKRTDKFIVSRREGK